MKRTVWITGFLLLAGVLILAGSFLRMADATSQAGKKIKEMAEKARFNTGGLWLLVPLADRATHNQEAILRVAELVSTFGYHTLPLIEVAKIASETDFECPYFTEIAPLAVMKLSGTPQVVQLARMAQKATTRADKEEVEKAIQLLKAGAEFKTYEEALSYNAKQMDTLSLRPPPGTQAPAVEKIWQLASTNRFNNGALKQMASLAGSARHNQEAILRIAEIASAFGYHTRPLVDIAEIASKTEFESPYFQEIAPLVVMKLSGPGQAVDLARKAQQARTKAEQDDLEQAIQRMKAGADLKSYEEALKYNAGMLKKYGL